MKIYSRWHLASTHIQTHAPLLSLSSPSPHSLPPLLPSSPCPPCSDTYVTSESGTGVVHQAPGFGEDDFRIALHYGIQHKGKPVVCPVDASGRFTDEVTDFKGQYVKVSQVEVFDLTAPCSHERN